MATYSEIATLLSPGGDGGLRERVMVATLLSLKRLRDEAYADPLNPTAAEQERKRFAQRYMGIVTAQPLHLIEIFERVYRAVIIQNSGLPLATIQGASDAAVQSAVDVWVDFFAERFNDPTP